jgi:hypothetical protein
VHATYPWVHPPLVSGALAPEAGLGRAEPPRSVAARERRSRSVRNRRFNSDEPIKRAATPRALSRSPRRQRFRLHAIVGTERKTWFARLWGAFDPVEVLTEVTSGLTITLVAIVVVGTVWGRVAGISPLTCGFVLASVGFVEIVAAYVLEAL